MGVATGKKFRNLINRYIGISGLGNVGRKPKKEKSQRVL